MDMFILFLVIMTFVLTIVLVAMYHFGKKPEFIVIDPRLRKSELKIDCSILNRTVYLNEEITYPKSQKIPYRGMIFFIHGLGEHLGFYGHVKQFFVNRGFGFYRYDLRGHGLSDGMRNHSLSLKEHLNDIKYILENRFKKNDKVYIIAHSFGSLLTLHLESMVGLCNINPNIKTIILTATTCSVDDASLIMIKLAKIVKTFLPGLKLEKPAHYSKYTYNKTFWEFFKKDSLRGKESLTVRFGLALLESVLFVSKNFENIQIPVLFNHGECDELIDPSGSEVAYNSVSSKEKKIILYPSMKHNILHEYDNQQVMKNIIRWIKYVNKI